MIELLKSKCMVGFLVLLIGFLFINAGSVQKMEETKEEKTNSYLVVNR